MREEVLLQQPLANLPLRAAAEQDAVRHHDAEPTRGVQYRHHVLDEREVPLRLRRHAEPKARIAIVLGHLAAPLVEAERRVGDHAVVEQQLTLIYELRIRIVSPFSIRALGQSVEQHVHLADGPGAEVLLLAMERQVAWIPALPLDVVRTLDQHAAGPGGRVADAPPLGRPQQLDDQLDHHPRRVELATLLARVVGELLDQVLVGAAEQVGLGHPVVPKGDLREAGPDARARCRGSSRRRACVRRCSRCRRERLQRAVLLLERRARLVQRLADVVGRPLDSAPPRPVRHEELVLIRIGPRHRLGDALGDELLRLFLEAIRQPLQEEQAEDVGLVVAAVDRSAQDVRRRPRGIARAARRSAPPRTSSMCPRPIETAPAARLPCCSSSLRPAP